MSVKNEWPTANINFAVVIQKSVVIFLCRAIFLAATVVLHYWVGKKQQSCYGILWVSKRPQMSPLEKQTNQQHDI
jgi:hypothetical protein